MRKVKDFYYKKAKQDKYPARSIYKLEEAQKKYHFLRRGDSVLDLGCCPGSWSLYTSETVGETGIVVAVDLQESEKAPRSGGAPIHWIVADIMDPELVQQVRKIRPAFKVLISDLAPKTTGNRWADHQQSLNLARQTLFMAETLLHEKGHFFCKAFQGEDFPAFVLEVQARFEQVKVVKPKSSRTESREVFVLGMGFKKLKGIPCKEEQQPLAVDSTCTP
ncbi:MAG: RlmE family RNA methyltransferase [Proteobacteria bacterium]|jgi:23S rRNA (uridine2552-2'-O)-methyltransferase|nr:RlmE family RNA methyltransferase [Desulfocapsa sp.]MBU3945307.1 RlmE family RNA methyltransferase [Pseudomonadota bacterium]MBU4028647.1 RlmE family RNA methyltransferase [Pseudomonadota bacterium]MBU4044377.1 RlmE family RNA methyltransferase [Pseudomonadota bacterium]MBU4083499.1 RlmE family RNA methyltransferase [Pseudomonadota bacterium]